MLCRSTTSRTRPPRSRSPASDARAFAAAAWSPGPPPPPRAAAAPPPPAQRGGVVVERSVGQHEQVGGQVGAARGGKVRQRVADPRDVGVGEEHVDAVREERRHLRPPPRLAVRLHQRAVGAEDAGARRAAQLALDVEPRRRADERRQPEAVEQPRPVERERAVLRVGERDDQRVRRRRVPGATIAGVSVYVLAAGSDAWWRTPRRRGARGAAAWRRWRRAAAAGGPGGSAPRSAHQAQKLPLRYLGDLRRAVHG